VNAAVGRFSN